MNSGYQDALDKLYSLERFGIKLGLDNIGRLLAELGDPQLACRAVHVGGTNGKGSVARTIAQILTTAGYITGLYTSPHLQRFTERIWLSGKEIRQDRVASLLDEIWQAMEKVLAQDPNGTSRPMTYFELVTAMAAKYFEQENADIVVWEVGMGGRLDATNTISPLVTIITTIAFEHQQHLGRSLAEIAGEKAGIIKPDVPVLTSVSQEAALDVITSIAKERGAPLLRLGEDFSYTRRGKGHMNYEGLSLEIDDLHLKLEGEHQMANAALAIAALEILKNYFFTTDDEIREGISRVSWPGRMERFKLDHGIILDGAHNADAAKALAAALTYAPSRGKRVMLAGLGDDKDVDSFFRILSPHVAKIFVTRSARPQAIAPDELAQTAGQYTAHVETTDDVRSGLERARADLETEDELLICGSLFVVGEAREIIQKELNPG